MGQAVRATRVRRLRIHRATQATTIVAGITLVAATLSFAVRKDITLVLGDDAHPMSTTSSSVAELMETTGVPLSFGLQVEPPPATELADGMTVTVSPPPGLPADALSGTVTPEGVGVWVVERASSEPNGKAAPVLDVAPASAVGAGQNPVVAVQAVVFGKVHDVLTNADSTGSLLSAMGIQPGASDRVAPSPDTPLHDGDTVRIDRIETEVRHATVPIPFEVSTTYHEDMVPGNVRVVRDGEDGSREQRVRVTYVNGVETARIIVWSNVVREPVDEVRESGPYSMYDGTLTEPGTGATTQEGHATWYDPPWSGSTAAHPWLPFGTLVTVTDLDSGRSVTVTINDRGPFAPGRIIDLSPEAFGALAPVGRGVLRVGLTW
ncbi:MAG TPA: RlpA-like double-psi beta-barrel domain-containing protein [Actinomycetota bacterium]|nr:RlpA-like double-psi beta-barrel domain-containing protein [Actinomycetota bacterium]